MIEFHVYGTPAPKGSGRAMLIAGRPVLVPSGSNHNRKQLREWDRAIKRAALAALGAVPRPRFSDTPLYVRIVFFLARPASHYNAKGGLHPWALAEQPTVKPDKDKLERATLDALTEIIFDDDSRIVDGRTTKQYADTPADAGAFIRVKEFRRAVETTPLFAETRAGP